MKEYVLHFRKIPEEENLERYYYIDGNNFMHYWNRTAKYMQHGKFGKAQSTLISALNRNPRLKKYQIWLFFDGIAGEDAPKPFGRFRIIFSGSSTADKMIMEQLMVQYKKKTEQGRSVEIIVVSNDQEVCGMAYRFDFRPLKNDEFLKLLQMNESYDKPEDDVPEKPDRELTDREISEWKSIFGANDADYPDSE